MHCDVQNYMNVQWESMLKRLSMNKLHDPNNFLHSHMTIRGSVGRWDRKLNVVLPADPLSALSSTCADCFSASKCTVYFETVRMSNESQVEEAFTEQTWSMVSPPENMGPVLTRPGSSLAISSHTMLTYLHRNARDNSGQQICPLRVPLIHHTIH